MDHALTCNNLKCRKELTERALVTTCSHIFCLHCADQSGVTGQQSTGRHPSCPACRAVLEKPDDAVIAILNPTEDYKTSVLSGLSPNIIMECAGRALSFWAYQTTQDICYQQHLYKVLGDKFSSLNVQLDKTISDANSEIESLRGKLTAMSSEHEHLRRKNEELAQAYREKNRKLLQTQELYDKVKRKAELGQIQRAASDAVDSTLQQAAQSYSRTFQGGYNSQETDEQHRVQSLGSNGRLASFGEINPPGLPRSRLPQLTDDIRWGRPTVAARPEISAAPIDGAMRQRIGLPSMTGAPGFGYGATPIQNQTLGRRPLSENTPNFANSRAGLSGGLTSGLKIGQPGSLSGHDTSQRGH